MNTLKFVALLFLISFLSCDKENNPIDDLDQTAALKNVEFTYDSISYMLGLPEGALDGKTFAELMKADSSTYANPANYTIGFGINLTADNTKSDAKDAKFDGLLAYLIMDTIRSAPIATEAEAFTVSKGETEHVQAIGSINLESHKRTGIYIFQQMVDGEDLSTTIATYLQYKFGILEGDIPLPEVQKDIPTRASDETKAFLKGLLESGILAIQE